ncbi:MAG: glycosyltransferase N-terminal domain-containing protein [Bacteriovoracaceae bacterium]|nr:3-deoxy-D-manno-octulosonic acid transferase [Bacteroidota bacterium]
MNTYLIAYNIIVIPLLWCVFYFGGFVNKKIRRGIDGRTHLFRDLHNQIKKLNGTARFWFHASSLGEFEQAKPIIAEIKKLHPQVDIIATFFSPSGFENSKNYKLANIISYIPFDSIRNVTAFIELIKPDVAIMVRYDIWPNMIYALQKRAIPIVIANATMKDDSLRMIPLFRQFHRSLYNCFTQILTVSQNDERAFRNFGTTVPVIDAIGDTRFDQVMLRSIDARQKHLLSDAIIGQKKIFVVGQSWGEDDDVIVPVLRTLQRYEKSLLTIIVPHEPTVEHLEALEAKLEGIISFKRFSEMNTYQQEKVILIDSIGVLVALYQYAHVVYIGGSFRQGIHNVLEPAVFGVPVIYGPKHTNSQEAVELAKRGGGFVVEQERDLYRTLRSLLENPDARSIAGSISECFVREHCGATERILQYLQPYLK